MIAVAQTHRDALALFCFGAWVGCSALSRVVGVWFAVGTAGIILGALVLTCDWKALRPDLRFTAQRFAAGVLGGILMTAVTYLAFPWLRAWMPDVVSQATNLYKTFGGSTGWRALLVLPLVVVGEELVWRGAVQDALARRVSPPWEVLGATLAYSLSVVSVGSPLLLAIALGCGLYWSLVKRLSGSLLAPLITHLIWDLFVFVLAPLG